jgi:PAS domain S-box-containing protein
MFDFAFSNLTGFLFAFIPALISLGLVVYILLALPRTRLADIFTVLTLCGGLWQLGDSTARISVNHQTADLWDTIFCFGWIFMAPLCVHFAILYSRLVNNATILPWTIGTLYFPAFLFLALYQSHVYPHFFQYSDFWGWVNYHNSTNIERLLVAWIAALVLISVVILFYHAYRVRKDSLLFSQAIIIALGIAIPALGGIVAQVLYPLLLGMPAIPVTSYFLTFLSVATVLALKKYRLFTISELISNEVLLDDLPVAVLSISDTGHITYMNRNCEKMLDIKRDSLKKPRYNKLMFYALPEHERNFKAAYSRALKGQYLHDVESSLVVRDRTLNVMMSVSPINNNNKTRGVLFCIRDITELKASLQLTEKSVTSLKEAQKISHIGSWEWMLEKNRMIWSDELYRIYGLQPGTPLSFKNIMGFTHPDDVLLVMGKIQVATEAHQAVDFTYRIQPFHGNDIKYLHARLKVVEAFLDSPARLFGTVQDITQQVQIENDLQEKNKELMRSNANLEEFLFVASHDLKEPIRKIITFADMIVGTEQDHLSEKSRGYFQRILSAARRMQTLIQDLLSLSTITQNNEYENCSLQQILHEALEDLELKIKEKNAIIEFDELPSVQVNHIQFRQLFVNLISNSLKFAKKDTQPVVKITSKILKSREAESYSLLGEAGYLKITLSDNGIGFENLYANKIFQMFQRLNGKVDYEGTGIGLAVCKKIVENHKGIITATGSPGEGATFNIVIPTVHQSTAHGELV